MTIEILFIIFNIVFFINNLFYLNLVEGVFNIQNNKIKIVAFGIMTSLFGSGALLFFGSMSALGYTIMLTVYTVAVMTFYQKQSIITRFAFVLHFNLHIMVARGLITSILSLILNVSIIDLSRNLNSFWTILILTSILCSTFTIGLLMVIPTKYLRVIGAKTQAVEIYTAILAFANVYMIANGNIYIHDISYNALPLHQIIASLTWLGVSYAGIFMLIGFDILKEKKEDSIYRQSVEKDSIIIAEINCTKNKMLRLNRFSKEEEIKHDTYSDFQYEILKDRLTEQDFEMLYDFMSIENILKNYENNITTLKTEFFAKMADDELRWVRASITINEEKYTDDVIAIFSIIDDVHDAKMKELELSDTAKKDPLVGAYNKKATQEIIDSLLKSGIKGALMMVDLDNFKAINDNFGHIYGDEVLKEVFLKIQKNVRGDDIIGRIGGDEFIIFLKHINSVEEILKKADLICKNINKIYTQDGVNIEISSSIGIALALAEDDSISFTELYHKADLAMYIKKKESKNGFILYDKKTMGE